MAVVTFEQFKADIINRQKRVDIDKLLHLYIKAETFEDIVQIVKSTANVSWAIEYGILNEETISQIPSAILETELVLNTRETITNPTKTVLVREGGEVTINIDDTNRVTVILLGGKASINTSDLSMVDIEAYNDSSVSILSEGESYCYITTNHQSDSDAILKESSICRLNSQGDSQISIDIQEQAFLNALTEWNSYLKITGKINNSKLRKHGNSVISRQIK